MNDNPLQVLYHNIPGAIPPKFCYNERTPRGYSADGGVNQILFQRLATGNKRSEQRG